MKVTTHVQAHRGRRSSRRAGAIGVSSPTKTSGTTTSCAGRRWWRTWSSWPRERPSPCPSNAATATIRGLGSKPSRQELARRWNCDSCGCSGSMESESPSFKITKRYIPSPSPSRKIFRASRARPLRKICETVSASHQESLVGQGRAALR